MPEATYVKPLAFSRRAKGRDFWRCRCPCGRAFISELRMVKIGRIRSCGCLLKARKNHFVHGKRREAGRTTPEYSAWSHMVQRCTNPNHPQFNSYGGAGITVCQRWRKSFALFFADMGPKPSPKHSIGCVGRCYAPSKCRWVTPI